MNAETVESGAQSEKAAVSMTNIEPKEKAKAASSGSVSDQIIDEFLTTLAGHENYLDISKNLKELVRSGKPNEAKLRRAIFGDATE